MMDDSPEAEGRDGSVDDAHLLEASLHNRDAFAELYERHNTALLAYFARRTACPQTAADLTAETFAQAFSSRGRFTRTGAPARAWLFTIGRRQLSRFVRRETVSAKYRHRLGLETTTSLEPTDIERIDELMATDPQRRAVVDALKTLPESQRQAIQLRVADDLPYSRVAERLGCSEGAARVRVSRGLTALADLLQPGIDREATR